MPMRVSSIGDLHDQKTPYFSNAHITDPLPLNAHDKTSILTVPQSSEKPLHHILSTSQAFSFGQTSVCDVAILQILGLCGYFAHRGVEDGTNVQLRIYPELQFVLGAVQLFNSGYILSCEWF